MWFSLLFLTSLLSIAVGLALPQSFPYPNPSDPLGQLNFYSDQDCTQWTLSVNVTDGYDNGCFNYEIGNAGSMNIVNYYGFSYNTLTCWWYVDQNCEGSYYQAALGPSSGNAVTDQNNNQDCVQTSETIWEPLSIRCSDFYS